MKTLRLASLLSMSLFATACGPANVQYNLACVATCTATSTTAAVALTACGADGQDPTAIAAANVDACLTEAKKGGCMELTCACQAERTTTMCTK